MFSKKLITTIGVLVTLMTLIGGIWAFNNTFATNERVDKEVENIEIQVAGALQNQQIKSDYNFYLFLYDKLSQDMVDIQRQLRTNPYDEMLRQDYLDKKEERIRVKQKMEEMMKKIN